MDAHITTCPACNTRNRVPAVAAGVPQCATCHAPLPWIADAHDADFAAVSDSSKLLVLVDLWAPWCGPCKQYSPVLERLAAQYAGRLKLVKVNVDESPATQASFGVQSIPTLVLLRDGQVVARQAGAMSLGALRRWVEPHLD
ncbi:thioredoxin [Luteococcus sp.]|jgi:thioredoxin 2|uniref:thioredoxin n=1 Tax=Luteococcus sp. TaxID=1969402 RepID=UPI003734F5FD